jgi:hypothetical protein
MGRITPVMNYIRRVLIEDIYARLSKAIRIGIEVERALIYVA